MAANNRINCIYDLLGLAPKETHVKPTSTTKTTTTSTSKPRTRPAAAKVSAKAAAETRPRVSAPAVVTTPAAQEKPAKPPKLRLVRDSFTMPEADFALVAVLKSRALGLGRAVKKSELLRAGLQLLGQQEPAALLASLDGLQPIKTGRPRRAD